MQHLAARDAFDVQKPKWMRWKTYNGLRARLHAADVEIDQYLDALLVRLDHRKQEQHFA
jgi:hypothetical protein